MSKREPRKVPPHTDVELRQFVHDWVSGLVVSSNNVAPSMVPLIFAPLAFGAFNGWTKREIAQVGIIYAVEGSTQTMGGMAINGVHMFASCRLMSRADWKRARTAIRVEQERRKSIPV